jgi:thioester reductase-like protein
VTTLITGFPGLIATALLERLLQMRPDESFTCLVENRARGVAQHRVGELERRDRAVEGRIRLVEGDITEPDLGFDGARWRELAASTSEVFHLAAIYDVHVSEDVATAVNVEGTRNVARFAESCGELRRFHHMSSFGVAGHHPGVFTETDLDVGQPFRNHYVRSKFQAECVVRELADDGLPTTVYRPGYVVGDSDTGATQKYDGPYFLIRWILRQPKRLSMVPTIGDPRRTHPNVVPRDFVADATALLSGLDDSLGTTYQLVDPDPPDLRELIELIGAATGHRVVAVKMPFGLTKRVLSPSLVQRIAGMPAEVLDYFDHPTTFTCVHTLRDLAGTGIGCPPLASYLPVLVEFVREHPEIGPAARA